MKILMLLLVPLLIFGQVKQTEIQYGDGIEFYIYASSVDSGVYNSSELSELVNYDADFVSNPIGYQLKLDTLTADASNTEIVGIYVQGYLIDAWTNIDTILAADTLNGSHTLASGTFYAKGVLNLNQVGWAFPKMRVSVVATHDLGNLFAYYLKLYCYKRD